MRLSKRVIKCNSGQVSELGSNVKVSKKQLNYQTAKLATLLNCQTNNIRNELSSVTVGKFPS